MGLLDQKKEMENKMEPRLSPPVDEKLERVTSYVDNIALEDLAYEIQSYGLDEKVKETIAGVRDTKCKRFCSRNNSKWEC